jgi:hypothetical protein
MYNNNMKNYIKQHSQLTHVKQLIQTEHDQNDWRFIIEGFGGKRALAIFGNKRNLFGNKRNLLCSILAKNC